MRRVWDEGSTVKALRWVVGTIGELLITLGVLLLLFVAWQLWWTDVTACSLLAVTSVHHSCHATNSNSNTPRVINSSPIVPTTQRSAFTVEPSSPTLRIQKTQAPLVCREGRLCPAGHVIAQTEQVGVLPVDPDLLTPVQSCTHGSLVANRLDDIGRRVDPPLQDQRVADAAHGAGRDDALVLQHHRLGTPCPQRVDHGLDVLLVHDDVIGGVPRGQACGRALGVVQTDRKGWTGHALGADARRQPGGFGV